MKETHEDFLHGTRNLGCNKEKKLMFSINENSAQANTTQPRKIPTQPHRCEAPSPRSLDTADLLPQTLPALHPPHPHQSVTACQHFPPMPIVREGSQHHHANTQPCTDPSSAPRAKVQHTHPQWGSRLQARSRAQADQVQNQVLSAPPHETHPSHAERSPPPRHCTQAREQSHDPSQQNHTQAAQQHEPQAWTSPNRAAQSKPDWDQAHPTQSSFTRDM